ncbi:MAG TPA: DUF3761 domain-containing protein [Myxococcales bacterium]|nr:DUF3761 domain-containing protein [Myxococcales bacterium]
MTGLGRFIPKALAIALSLVLVPAAAEAKSKKAAATVTCKDGTTSKAGRGACSHHGGVSQAAPAKDAARERSDEPDAEPRTPDAREAPRTQGRAAARTERAPSTSAPSPGQPTARCKDGSMSYAKQHSGACSHHGGVAEWLQ